MKLNIENFGAISKANISIDKFTIIIGEQASGKSTISKLIYYFLNIRDDIKEYIFDNLKQNEGSKSIRINVEKKIKRRFLEFFGPAVHDKNLDVSFTYSDRFNISLTASKSDRKYLNISIGESLFGLITEIIKQNSERFQKNYSQVKLFGNQQTSYTGIEIEKIQKEIDRRINTQFNFEFDLLFIPAGRSILSTLSDQLQNIHPHLLDFPMRVFIEKVTSTKAFFRKDIDQIIKDKITFEKITTPSWHSQMQKAKAMAIKVIKGKYQHDDSGGKIIIDSGRYVKINYTSSGQQESVWIVLSLFLLALDHINAMVFIEEPEAHLFPNGQKDITDFILFIYNTLNTRFVITTHSPYILSSLNNAIYASEIYHKNKNLPNVYDRDLFLKFSDTQAFTTQSGNLIDIVDREMKLIDVKFIDDCSREINDTYAKLEDMEFSHE